MTRRAVSGACTALGLAVLALALIFAFLPGVPQVCGSLLVPAYPPGQGVLCARAQGTWFGAMVGCSLASLAMLIAGAVAVPSRRRR